MKPNQIPLCKVSDYLPISEIKFFPDNPRTIRPERLIDLKRSMISKGVYKPMLVNKKGLIALEGNHRLLAARELIEEGYEFVTPNGESNLMPVVFEDCSEEQAKAILFESNNSYAEWIEERVTEALRNVEEPISYGFTQDQLDNFLDVALSETKSVETPGEEDALPDFEDDTLRGDDRKERDEDEIAREDEDYETLVLRRSAYNPLMKLLSQIAVSLNPKWEDGDSLEEAVLHLVASNKNVIARRKKKTKKGKKRKK